MPKNMDAKEGYMTIFDNDGNIEEKDEVQIITKVQKRHFKKGEFFMANKQISKLVLTKKYTGETFRLLFLLLDKIDYNNRIKSFTQIQLGEELGISQSNISKSLKILKADSIIYKDGRDYYFSDKYIKYAGDTN